jgi:hypothetical protein
LGFLSKGISTLHLGTTVFQVAATQIAHLASAICVGYILFSLALVFCFLQKMIALSLTTKMPTMKTLALDIGGNLDALVDFLKCFPCLEKLYIIVSIRIFTFK